MIFRIILQTILIPIHTMLAVRKMKRETVRKICDTLSQSLLYGVWKKKTQMVENFQIKESEETEASLTKNIKLCVCVCATISSSSTHTNLTKLTPNYASTENHL